MKNEKKGPCNNNGGSYFIIDTRGLFSGRDFRNYIYDSWADIIVMAMKGENFITSFLGPYFIFFILGIIVLILITVVVFGMRPDTIRDFIDFFKGFVPK